jgi:pimeloyl-ACP methyl ester carboxylesterase
MINHNIMVGFKSVAVGSRRVQPCCRIGLAAPVKNIVLVHGAWVDGSGWRPVYDILVRDGYNVTMVQEPETSFQDDVTAAKRVLERQPGPCILVGHSYGGSIITEVLPPTNRLGS